VSAPPPALSAPLVAPGSVKLIVQHASGHPLFALVGERIVLRGIVRPYVPGQQVRVIFYRDGHRGKVTILGVHATVHGAGEFRVGYSSPFGGSVQAHAAHSATPDQSAFSGRSASVRIVNPDLGPGAQSQSVGLLQSELYALHYAVPLNGVFEEATGRAVIAFRKLTGMARVPFSNTEVFRRLQLGAGSFHVRYRGDGRHVEADLTSQVLAEIESRGHVRAIYTMSSGKPSTPTVVGRFSVYLKTPGVNAKGMVDSNYFIRGYAIHGYPEVPTFAASHGCLRVPIPSAASIFSWLAIGTPVDVYNDGGGGSGSINANAGP
jgi:hypothetical protein